jgi:CheY-like chemotaxis protein
MTDQVLVIEDDPDISLGIKTVLDRSGFEVAEANTGREGLRAFHAHQPDLVVLDIGLPEMDGYELAQRLRSVPGLADTPFVAVTGYAQDDDRRRALANGFTEHLAKPLTPDRVIECIKDFCPLAR